MSVLSGTYLIRSGRAGIDAVQVRVPELAPLRDKRIAVFGLGCLGAPSQFIDQHRFKDAFANFGEQRPGYFHQSRAAVQAAQIDAVA